ncbi:unnamed protein product [Calicophoron daubneyi]|uniref:Cystatin domain-containing protein n=1 Tax=Calicophoron daubneyi TaxID=300641 RepID=A0AAV2TG43_CALDB
MSRHVVMMTMWNDSQTSRLRSVISDINTDALPPIPLYKLHFHRLLHSLKSQAFRLDSILPTSFKMRAGYLLLLMSFVAVNAQGIISGGLTEPRPTSGHEEHKLRRLIKAELPEYLGKEIGGFEIISVQTQVVAGINYYVLIRFHTGKCMTVVIFEPLKFTGGNMHIVQAEDSRC